LHGTAKFTQIGIFGLMPSGNPGADVDLAVHEDIFTSRLIDINDGPKNI
jgi:hypothetical protein